MAFEGLKAYEDGEDAFKDGKSIASNPHKAKAKNLYGSWQDGWLNAGGSKQVAEIVKLYVGGNKKAAKQVEELLAAGIVSFDKGKN